jgi:hypothetical protein
VELLVTTSLMALVGGATVASLSGGMKVWKRASQFGVAKESMLIACDWLRRDLQNIRRFAPVPFEGAYDRYTFATVAQDASDDRALPEIGQFGYFVDAPHRQLCRSFVPYRLMRQVRLTDRCQGVLDNVSRVRFSYFGTTTKQGRPEWRASWDMAEPPLAVKAELSAQDPGQEATSHTIVVRLAGSPGPGEEDGQNK